MAFTHSLTVNKEEEHKQDVRILDNDVSIYGVFREDKGNIAHIVKHDDKGAQVLLADIQWVGDRRDKLRFPEGEWQKLEEAWTHYDFRKDKERFSSSFTGADGRKYVWHVSGATKVLSIEHRTGPIAAQYTDNGRGGILELNEDGYKAGDMLFITFLAAEAIQGRPRRSWNDAFSTGGWLAPLINVISN